MVIPAAIRRELGIMAGTRMRVEMDEAGQRIILTPITRAHVHRLRGKYRGKQLLGALVTNKASELGEGSA